MILSQKLTIALGGVLKRNRGRVLSGLDHSGSDFCHLKFIRTVNLKVGTIKSVILPMKGIVGSIIQSQALPESRF